METYLVVSGGLTRAMDCVERACRQTPGFPEVDVQDVLNLAAAECGRDRFNGPECGETFWFHPDPAIWRLDPTTQHEVAIYCPTDHSNRYGRAVWWAKTHSDEIAPLQEPPDWAAKAVVPRE